MRKTAHAQNDAAEALGAECEAVDAFSQILATRTFTPTAALGETLTGHLDGIDGEGRVLFLPEAGGRSPFPVAIGLPIPDAALVKAARTGARALALRVSGPGERWVLVGLLRERVGEKARDAAPGQLEITVDGETVRIEAQHQIELRCGRSKLLLRKDGRVVLSGSYVLTKSTGPNKIKGATIALN